MMLYLLLEVEEISIYFIATHALGFTALEHLLRASSPSSPRPIRAQVIRALSFFPKRSPGTCSNCTQPHRLYSPIAFPSGVVRSRCHHVVLRPHPSPYCSCPLQPKHRQPAASHLPLQRRSLLRHHLRTHQTSRQHRHHRPRGPRKSIFHLASAEYCTTNIGLTPVYRPLSQPPSPNVNQKKVSPPSSTMVPSTKPQRSANAVSPSRPRTSNIKPRPATTPTSTAQATPTISKT